MFLFAPFVLHEGILTINIQIHALAGEVSMALRNSRRTSRLAVLERAELGWAGLGRRKISEAVLSGGL
jgi:hypothetical protein